jgi:UDP-glucose 4-epimerase
MAKVVLVTGVSRYLGGIVARKLSETPGITKVIGVDVIPPTHDLGRTTFVRADIRNPMIAKVIENDKVDTVVHMNVIATPTSVGGRSPQKEINVIGTMQLLAACQKATSLKRLVVKSSAAVYGATSRDPAMFSEDMSAKRMPSGGFGKDSVEVEGYVRGFARRRPDIEIVTLRLANVIGPRIRTSMTDYFTLPVIPVPMGFDARLQFVHEDDAVAGMLLATTGSMTGTINVAGEGVLTVMQAVSLARRVPVPIVLQAAGPVGGFAKRLGLADFSPDQLSLLAFGRGLDTERMHSVLGLEPRYTTREAFVDFISSTRGRLSSAAGKER